MSEDDASFQCFFSDAEKDASGDPANVVDGLFAIARGLEAVARSIRDLGNADAATPMGAMEALGDVMHKGFDSISTSIGAGLTEIAYAIEANGPPSPPIPVVERKP